MSRRKIVTGITSWIYIVRCVASFCQHYSGTNPMKECITPVSRAEGDGAVTDYADPMSIAKPSLRLAITITLGQRGGLKHSALFLPSGPTSPDNT